MKKKDENPKLYFVAAILFLLAGIIGQTMYCFPLGAVFLILGLMKNKK